MKDILEEIIASKQLLIEQQKKVVSYAQMNDALQDIAPCRSMSGALATSATGIIAEFKRRSPSKGWIRQEAQPQEIIPAYEAGGATALSILTDEKYFGGGLKDMRAARPLAGIPILRKDFIIDEYQLLQAKIVGADAVLLIAAALSQTDCRRLTQATRELQMEVLLEIHSEAELVYVTDLVDMVGVNNRNLGTFHTDVDNSFRLSTLLPADKLLVSESGISSPVTITRLREAGYRGFLIGETFMRTEHPGDTLREFINALSVRPC